MCYYSLTPAGYTMTRVRHLEVADASVVCPTEILAFNKAIEDFKAIGAEVIVSSTDSEFTHLAWSQMNRKEGGLGPDLKLTMVR